ncbi:MAG: hypothetical protein WC785_01690 [Tatlockia sp.]|jgi:hypothetical protein
MKKHAKDHPEIKEIKNICDILPNDKKTKAVCDVLKKNKKPRKN